MNPIKDRILSVMSVFSSMLDNFQVPPVAEVAFKNALVELKNIATDIELLAGEPVPVDAAGVPEKLTMMQETLHIIGQTVDRIFMHTAPTTATTAGAPAAPLAPPAAQ